VVAEGEPADDLYVVRSGTLTVTVAGAAEQPPDLGPGDVFGEIGLLRGGVRTATVTAVDDVELDRISGTMFVDIATPSASAASPLLGGMRTRLHRTHPHLAEPVPETS
jgi:CRP-like cAMP-binding protein